jgi:pyruvate kinase
MQAQQERHSLSLDDLIALNTYLSTQALNPSVVFAPTKRGNTPRQLARFHMAQPIIAFALDEGICRKLQFSYGVYPVHPESRPPDWLSYARTWALEHLPDAKLALIVTGTGTLDAGGSRRTEAFALH